MKVGRSDPCPCGRGRKLKKCCIDEGHSTDAAEPAAALTPLLPIERVYAQFLDIENRRRIVTTNDVLFKQLQRDCPRITEGFDSLCAEDLKALNEELCHFVAVLAAATTRFPDGPSRQHLHVSCCTLLSNAMMTFLSALELTRRGFRLQPPILLRNVLESVSTAFHVVMNTSDLDKLQKGKLQSSRTIGSAKKIFPHFGHMYGLLSNDFVHIGDFHVSLDELNGISQWQQGDEALTFLLRALRFSIWSISVAAELSFFDSLPKHRFFQRLSDGRYRYAPTAAERKRMEDFLV